MNKTLLHCAIKCILGRESNAFEKLYTIDVIGVTPRGQLELSFGYRMETEKTETPGIVRVVNWQDIPQHEVIAQMNITLERFKQLYETSFNPSNQEAWSSHAPLNQRDDAEDF